jgi:hypothetical protein
MDLNQPPQPPRWRCSWIGENGQQCTKWAQRRRLCQRHLLQREQQQSLRATTEPARISNNDAPAPVGNIANNGATLTATTINCLNDQLELRDRRMRELEAKIVDLESKMTALSESVGDFKCTFVNSNSRFSHMTGFTMTGFTLGEGLNFVGQGRHRGDEEVGDEEEDSGNGDQKRNAHKRKHAPEGLEGKRDNEEDGNGNGDQKPKARKKRCSKR